MNFEPFITGKKTIPKIASERLLVKGGKIVNHDLSLRADIFIENGIIKQLGTDLTIPGGVTVIDAKGALILPGGIDITTNFETLPWLDSDEQSLEMKSVDNFYSGTRAALLGGTTTIIDFVTGDQGHLLTAFNERVEACSTSCCDVSFHVDVTSWNDEVRQAMMTLARKHGVNSFRIQTCDRWQMNDTELYEIFEHIKSLECVALVHAENGSLIRKKTKLLKEKGKTQPSDILTARDEELECEAVNRVLLIAKQMFCPIFFLNVTGQKSMENIAKARADGFPVYCQTLAVSLYRNGSAYKDSSWNQSASCIIHPPMRDDINAQKLLLSALSNESYQCVSSGHRVFNNATKASLGKSDFSKIPQGVNGVYERLMALWTTAVVPGYIDQNLFVALTSTNAARIFNLFPKKGYIAVGSDADLIIWCDNQPRLLSESASLLNVNKADCTNAFTGLECDSGPKAVICHGRVVFNDNQISVVQSMGKLLTRPTGSPFIYNRLRARDKANSTTTTSLDKETSQVTLQHNGNHVDDEKIKTNEKPERYTRSSGIRSMHQSGWSFSGEQLTDVERKKINRHVVPSGRTSQPFFY